MATAFPNDRGVTVEFRLTITDALLWSSVMLFVPRVDDVVEYGLNSGGLTSYEVMSVRYEFREAVPLIEDPPPDPPEVVHCSHVVIITVKIGV